MSAQSARARRLRLSASRKRADGWPYCEHDGTERIVGTAAEHVIQITRVFPPADARQICRGVELLAADTGPEALIGVCPACFCMTTRDAPAHR